MVGIHPTNKTFSSTSISSLSDDNIQYVALKLRRILDKIKFEVLAQWSRDVRISTFLYMYTISHCSKLVPPRHKTQVFYFYAHKTLPYLGSAICYSCNELVCTGIQELLIGERRVYNGLKATLQPRNTDILPFDGEQWGMYHFH
ncbi:unnamed protein product [Rhizophagus irregularis]|nr:unnamed protein product [Rhizophagus irregularis]